MEAIKRMKQEPEKVQEVKQFKISVVGMEGCGKTTLCRAFAGEDCTVIDETVGSSFYANFIPGASTMQKIQVTLWDLSGAKGYQDVRNEFYRESNALLLVYDITNKRSFDCLEDWLREVSKFGGEALPVFVCGTKCDNEHSRAVTNYDGDDFVKS